MFGESRFSRSGRCGSFWQRGCGNFFAWFAGRTAPQCTPCDHSCWNVTNQKCNKPCGFRTNRTCDRTLNMVKMAAGHLPTSSHNFAWRGVINHDRTTKLTLQNKYDHTRPAGYPKVASPLEISFWIRNLFSDTSRPLRHRQRSDRPSSRRCLPWRHHRVTWITWPPLWRSPHSPNSEIFTAPEQYVFHSDGERR